MFDLPSLITTFGYFGIAAIVFIESGLFFGFFLPGDSLLFAAGVLAAQGYFDIRILIPLIVVSAILGDSVGYWFGKKVGPMIFKKPDSFWFSHERVEDARMFFEKSGGMSLILARFIPTVRTFVPIVAGAAHMEYKKFLTYNIIGGVVWGVSMTCLGYFLGTVVTGIDHYILPGVLAIMIISSIPMITRFSSYYLKRRNPQK